MTRTAMLVALSMPLVRSSSAQESEGARPAEEWNVQAIRRLTREEANRNLPVRIRGVLTYYEAHASLAFVHDGSGCIYVGQRSGRNWLRGIFNPAQGLRSGQLIEIEGVTEAGVFAPRIMRDPSDQRPIIPLGEAPLPKPLQPVAGALVNPRFHSEWVEVEGVVESVTTGIPYEPKPVHLADPNLPVRWVLKVRQGSEVFDAVIPNRPKGEPLPEELKDAEVRLRGVDVATYDATGRQTGMILYVPSMTHVSVLDAGPGDLSALPVRPVDQVLTFSPEERRRVHIQGTVVYVRQGREIYVWDDGQGLWVETGKDAAVRPGQIVDVIGFPTLADRRPRLLGGRVFAGAMGALPPAKTAVSAELAGLENDSWVEVEAAVAGELQTAGGRVLLMRSGTWLFEAAIPAADGAPPARAFPHETVLRMRGVWTRAARDSDGAAIPRLLTPAEFAVRVVREAPWWNRTRLAMAGGAAVAAAAASFGWVSTLRRKVRAQTHLIEDKTREETLAVERSRMARDLHDTMEQHLTVIATQLDLLAKKVPDTMPYRSTVESARAMLRFARTEARYSVWDLRMLAEAQPTLASALRRLTEVLASQAAVEIELTVRGAANAELNRRTKHLLRIAQEALTNAIKHAGASKLSVALEEESGLIRLRVSDNGRGFDPNGSEAYRAGHFGLLGMRERAEKIDAALEVESRPGEGVTILVSAPSLSPTPHEPRAAHSHSAG